MATEVKRRRGTTVEHSTFTGAVAELTVDLTKDTVVVHDGATQGGFPLLREDFSNVPTTAPFTNISLDTAIFDTTYTETGSETQGTLYWNSDEETLSLVTNGESIELGQKVEIHVKNQTGSQINKGEVVYASGTVGASGRILVTKMIADGTVAAKRVLGVAAENIANGADGKVIKFGKLRQINTSTFSDGDILWVSTSTAGAFQNTEPSQANGEIALPIAYVVYSSASVGEIFVRVTPIDENEYQDYDAGLQDIAGLTPTDSNIIVGDGTNWVAESGATARASLGLTIGTHVQAWDAQLDEIAALTPTDGVFIVGNGTSFVSESGNTARTSLGLGTGDSPTFTDVTLTGVLNTNEINTQSDLVWSTSTEVFSTSDYYIAGSLNIASSVYITDELDVAESLRVGTTLDVTGNTTLGGTVDISSNTTIGGTLTLSGSADFNSTMNLQGAMTTQNTIQSDNFDKGTGSTGWLADGATGFAIEDNAGIYDMYVDSLTVRGSLRVFELIAKQISAIGGTEILSVANGVVESSSGSAGSETVTLEDPTNTLATSFADFDLVLVQRFNPNNPSSLVKQEFRTVSVTSGLTITLTSTSGAPAPSSAIEAGDFIVAYGNTVSGSTRGNIIYRNVEGQPIVRLQTGIDSYADFGTPTTTTRIAYGDLDGFSGQSSGTFGFFAGDNSAEHVLIKGDGLFFKDNSTVLAELTSNTFKVGDDTNFLSFNGSAFNIQTNTFDLDATTLVIDSATNSGKIALGSTPPTAYNSGTGIYFDGTGKALIGNASGSKIQFSGSVLDINVASFNLESSSIQVGDSIELSTSEITTTYDYTGSTLVFSGVFNNTYNYFGYLEDIDDVNPDGYVFRVGDATNFMELNTSNNVAQINFDTFDLTSGNLRIKSSGTSYPSASANTEVTTADVTDFRIATLASGFNTNSLAISNNRWVKFQFDYSQSVPGSFTAGITVTLEVSTDNSTFTDYGLFSDTRIDFNTKYFVADNATGNRLDIVDESDSTKTSFRFKSSQTDSCSGTITMYFYVNEKDTTTHIRFNVLDSAKDAADSLPAVLTGASATNIGTRDYNPVTELNPSGVFTRLSDSLILSNGNTYIDYSLIT